MRCKGRDQVTRLSQEINELTQPDRLARVAAFTAAGQWIITIGAAMVAIGLTYNTVLARKKAEADIVTPPSGSHVLPR
ncbi:MAG: hypothetical protein OWU32_04020 [Firmicutes bacterium]|nr:hypothetical protein [Bacillota bacterium]